MKSEKVFVVESKLAGALAYRNVTQKKLASSCNISINQVANLTKGKVKKYVFDDLEKIAYYLKFDLKNLFTFKSLI